MARFDSLAELKESITTYINGSAVESFTNDRLQNIVYCICEFLAATVQVAAATDFTEASTTSTTVVYNWANIANATNYIIERSATGLSGWAQVYSGSTSAFTDTGLTPETTYYYRLKSQGTSLLDSDWATDAATTTA